MRVDLSRLFNSFSKRTEPQTTPKSLLSVEFRNRIIFLCQDNFYAPAFWEQIHRNLQYLHGRPMLSREGPRDALADMGQFLFECSDNHFLDLVEMIFRGRDSAVSGQHLVDQVNRFLEIDNLPYAVTDFVWESTVDDGYRSMQLIEYPKIIRRESQVLHSTAIQPTLEFLASPRFGSANQEFLGALEDYRKGNFPECLTKCNSSLESVMKVISDQKGWRYSQNDTASSLLRNILPQTGLGASFEQQLLAIPTIRNRYGSSHGRGALMVNTPKHVAQFAINATASAILLLVEETLL